MRKSYISHKRSAIADDYEVYDEEKVHMKEVSIAEALDSIKE